jgi:hypothetical protein
VEGGVLRRDASKELAFVLRAERFLQKFHL